MLTVYSRCGLIIDLFFSILAQYLTKYSAKKSILFCPGVREDFDRPVRKIGEQAVHAKGFDAETDQFRKACEVLRQIVDAKRERMHLQPEPLSNTDETAGNRVAVNFSRIVEMFDARAYAVRDLGYTSQPVRRFEFIVVCFRLTPAVVTDELDELHFAAQFVAQSYDLIGVETLNEYRILLAGIAEPRKLIQQQTADIDAFTPMPRGFEPTVTA